MRKVEIALCLFSMVLSASSSPARRRDTEEHDGSEYNDGLFEGDIAGFPVRAYEGRNGIGDDSYLWKYRKVYYVLSENFTLEERTKISDAIAEYHAKTCIRLYPLPTGDKLPPWMDDYLYITRENTGCWSYIGRLGRGRQQLNLQSPGCMNRGTILHEIMHAIGFWHEQSRPDRDDYITINWDNIQKGKENNFLRRGWDETTVLDQSYDVESVMHYDAYGFAIDRNIKVLTPIHDPNLELGQRVDFSKIDITKINRRYACT